MVLLFRCGETREQEVIELERLDLFLQSSGDGPCLDTKAPSQEAGNARGNGRNSRLTMAVAKQQKLLFACLSHLSAPCLLLTLKWLG